MKKTVKLVIIKVVIPFFFHGKREREREREREEFKAIPFYVCLFHVHTKD